VLNGAILEGKLNADLAEYKYIGFREHEQCLECVVRIVGVMLVQCDIGEPLVQLNLEVNLLEGDRGVCIFRDKEPLH
jgi:hypothetical protein